MGDGGGVGCDVDDCGGHIGYCGGDGRDQGKIGGDVGGDDVGGGVNVGGGGRGGSGNGGCDGGGDDDGVVADGGGGNGEGFCGGGGRDSGSGGDVVCVGYEGDVCYDARDGLMVIVGGCGDRGSGDAVFLSPP